MKPKCRRHTLCLIVTLKPAEEEVTKIVIDPSSDSNNMHMAQPPCSCWCIIIICRKSNYTVSHRRVLIKIQVQKEPVTTRQDKCLKYMLRSIRCPLPYTPVLPRCSYPIATRTYTEMAQKRRSRGLRIRLFCWWFASGRIQLHYLDTACKHGTCLLLVIPTAVRFLYPWDASVRYRSVWTESCMLGGIWNRYT